MPLPVRLIGLSARRARYLALAALLGARTAGRELRA